MGDYLADFNDWELAYHEAGHAIAAEIVGVGWTSVAVFPDDGTRIDYDGRPWLGLTRYVPRHDVPPSAWAFLAWAGCWAQARYTGEDLFTVQERSGGADMPRVDAYDAPWSEDAWALDLELRWSEIERLAERLVMTGTV